MTRDNFQSILGFFARYNLLPPRPKLIDVGCCVGWFSQDFLTFFPDAEITGIDLDARLAEEYLHSLTPPGAPHRFIHCGVSDFDGESPTFLSPQNFPTEIGTLVDRNDEDPNSRWVRGAQVQVHRLDSMFDEVDFIKIDAELMDLRVIAGAKKLLQNHKPIGIVFELVSQTQGYTDTESVKALLEPYGYRLLTDDAYDLWPAEEMPNLGVNTIAILNEAYERVPWRFHAPV